VIVSLLSQDEKQLYMIMTTIKYCALVIGSTLIIINLIGLFYAYPSLPSNYSYDPKEINVTSDDLDILPSELEYDYFKRLSRLIDSHVVHFWEPNSQYSHVSIFDNYLMYILSHFEHFKRFRDYEFITPQHVLDRGYGFCSQVAKLAYRKLKENGFFAKVYAHKNHTLLIAKDHNNKEYIIDPNFGVVIPYSLAEVYENLGLIEEYYAGEKPSQIDLLISVYASGYQEYFSDTHYNKLYNSERTLYILKWVIPLMFILIFLIIQIGLKKYLSSF
jgi:hypothetical protein